MCRNCQADWCRECCGLTRREFLWTTAKAAGAAGAAAIAGCAGGEAVRPASGPPPATPAALRPGAAGTALAPATRPSSRLAPTVKVAFVRRKGPYGLLWPGAVYDGEAARRMYTDKVLAAARRLNLGVDIRPDPIHSIAEADEWLAQARADSADGLLVILLDRQQHAWPTAVKAIESGIRTVVFSPLGTSFTTNTAGPSRKTGAVIYSTDDFSQAAYGLKMLGAAARMRASRVVVIRGGQAGESQFPVLGIRLRTVPARAFVDLYNATPETAEVREIAADCSRRAGKTIGATRQDVLNGARAYVAARRIIAENEADGITMDCLGALGPTKLSLPCLAWSRLNDEGVPAACEADIGAVASHVIVQYLFDRPGFQQDPVADTSDRTIIGSHCSCPTRLSGFDRPPEPFYLRHHHAERDATIQTLWRVGQPVTSVDVETDSKTGKVRMIVQGGKVVENVSVPPAGGCVVAVKVSFEGVQDVLANPGFHQVFFYGDYRRHLLDFCRLMNIEAAPAGA